MNIHDAPICVDCRFFDRTRTRGAHACLHVRVATHRDLVTGHVLPIELQMPIFPNDQPSCEWARCEYRGPCGRAGKLFEPMLVDDALEGARDG